VSNTAPHQQPAVIDKDTTNNNGLTSQALRYGLGGLAQPAPLQTFQWATGVFPGDSNGSTITDYQVTQTSPSASMGVLVQPGQLIVNRSLGGPYIGTSNAAFTVTIPASNTNPRIDYVVMRVRDLGIDGVGSAVQTYAAVVLSGTPSGSPSEPVSQLTDGDVLLAAITVRANTTTILNSDISDRRLFVTAEGGIYPMSAVDSRNGAYPGHTRFNMNTGSTEQWNGSAWVIIASPSVWSSWTPSLTYLGAGSVGAGTVNLGSGAIITGRYMLQGKKLQLAYTFQYGTSGFNSGAGAIRTTLPPGMTSRAVGETQILCQLYTGTTTALVFCGTAHIPANSNSIRPQFPQSLTQTNIGAWAVSGTQGTAGAAGTGWPLIAGQFSDGPAAILNVNGTIEIQ
jgi:hypothetical protein